MDLAKSIRDGLREAEISLEEIAGDRTPRLFPKTSYSIAADALVPFKRAIADFWSVVSEEWFAMSDAPLDATSILAVVNGRVRQVFYCGPWGVWLPDGTDVSVIDFEKDDVFGIGADLPTMWRHVPLAPDVRVDISEAGVAGAPLRKNLASLVLEYFRVRAVGAAADRLGAIEANMAYRARADAAAEAGNADPQAWVEIRVPGKSPQMKGPFGVSMLVSTLVELVSHRHGAYYTVITVEDGIPMLQDGGECIEQLAPAYADIVKTYRTERSRLLGA